MARPIDAMISSQILYLLSVNIDDSEQRRRRQRQQEQQRAANEKGQQKQTGVKRATDDYHYDKFKKQFRRY